MKSNHIRVEKSHSINRVPKNINYHVKKGQSKIFNSSSAAAVRMREHRIKPGVREAESKKDRERKKE